MRFDRATASVLLTVVAFLAVSGISSQTSASDVPGRWWWPLDPRPAVLTPYEEPPTPYAPGHRGVDLAGEPGAVVRSVDDGIVVFAGKVAGVAVVSIDHGGVRSTYQPVAATVTKGEHVAPGTPVGRLVIAGGHCYPRACLHLGRKYGQRYADPLGLIGGEVAVRLFTPYGPKPVPPPITAIGPGPGSLLPPVDAPISSPFGMRVHPVTGVLKLHDGTDFAAPCGTVVRAAATGSVTGATFDPAYGNRVVLDHGGGFSTTYNHLAGYEVSVGDSVPAGSALGTVGSTGLSTGCHLHFMAISDGTPVDPMSMLRP